MKRFLTAIAIALSFSGAIPVVAVADGNPLVKPLTGQPRYPSAEAAQSAYDTPGTSYDGYDDESMQQGLYLVLGTCLALLLLFVGFVFSSLFKVR